MCNLKKKKNTPLPSKNPNSTENRLVVARDRVGGQMKWIKNGQRIQTSSYKISKLCARFGSTYTKKKSKLWVCHVQHGDYIILFI